VKWFEKAWFAAASVSLVALVATTACADDDDATSDLPETQISTVIGKTDVVVNADQFPNFAHTCWQSTTVPVGFWSTTDRVTIIVYNDWLCPGATLESPMTVLSGNPRDVVNAGG
jgi:hypothetical protein